VLTGPPVVDLHLLEALVASRGWRVVAALPMAGGASTRLYFRLKLSGGTTAVAMFVPGGDRPEEMGQASREGTTRRRWPFLEVRDLLEARGVRVPRLLAENAKEGWLLLEDLGDETLDARLSSHPAERASLYTRAVTDLARAQAKLAPLPQDSVVATRSFDYDLLRRELDHFREWGLDAQGRRLSTEDRTALERIFDRLARQVAVLPQSFVHRDYQSRNLMVVGSELVWIDFQDALLGPRVYDLVALLHDSYQDLDDSFISARLGEYADAAGLPMAGRAELRRQFDLVAVQRKLKDAGRFVFIDRVKKNPSFLPYVEPTLRKVGRALGRLAPDSPDMTELRTILRRLMPAEFGG
jgi:aminoglycoside/choline kinase family phosphotransferase